MKPDSCNDVNRTKESLQIPETLEDMRKILGTGMRDLVNGRLDVGAARALGNLTGAFLKTIDLAEIEERLRKVEESMAAGRRPIQQSGNRSEADRGGDD